MKMNDHLQNHFNFFFNNTTKHMMFDKSLWHKVWILRGLVWSQWLNFIIHVALFQVGIFYDSMFYLYKIYSSFLKTKENKQKKIPTMVPRWFPFSRECTAHSVQLFHYNFTIIKSEQNLLFLTYPSTDFPVSSGLRTVNGLGSIPTFLGIKSLAKEEIKSHCKKSSKQNANIC